MKQKIPFILICLATIFMKTFTYYSFMGVLSNNLVFSVVTTFTIALLFLLFIKIDSKFNMIGFIVIYSILSLLMLVDTVYYKQFNMFTSVNLFNMAGKLGDVSESIKQILDVKFLFFMIDIPIVVFSVLKLKNKKLFDHKPKFITLVLMFTIVISSGFISNGLNYASKVTKTEFFNYHIGDIYRNWIVNTKVSYTNEQLKNLDAIKDKSNGKLFGVAKNNNLIVIQLESFQNFLINRTYNGQELTPFLNSIIKENSLYFTRYYDQVGYGNTSDAEFTTNNSLFGTLQGSTYDFYPRNVYNGLPWQLKSNGYSTVSMHGYKGDFWNRNMAHPYQGFDEFISMEDFKSGEMVGMGLSDPEVYRQSIGYLKKMNSPFYSFIISLSQHHPYKMPDKLIKIKLKAEDENTLLGNYLQAARYADDSLKEYFDELKEKGLYEKTVIAIYGDHHGLVVSDPASKKSMTRLLGKEYKLDEMAHVPLIIHSQSIKKAEKINIPGGQVDFMLTIMNILGVQNKNPYVFGQDLVNAKSGFVPMLMYTGKGSFIKDDAVFLIKTDGVFENASAWNPQNGEEINIKSCWDDYQKALAMFDMSDYVKEANLIEKIN